MTVKGQVEEILMEVQATYANSIEDIDKVFLDFHEQETKDKNNDLTRNRMQRFLLDALEANTAGSKELTDRALHAALQILNQQTQEDLSDDIPRTRGLAKLNAMKFRFIANQRIARSLQKRHNNGR